MSKPHIRYFSLLRYWTCYVRQDSNASNIEKAVQGIGYSPLAAYNNYIQERDKLAEIFRCAKTRRAK